MDTIVAISTAVGAGGIGIVRISGYKAQAIACALFFVREKKEQAATDEKSLQDTKKWVAFDAKNAESAKLYFGEVRCKGFSDTGYAVLFRAPYSFTGEDVVEFQVHGGARILQGIVDECVKLGARHAAAGEFSKRAFLNGKMDLVEAEGIIDMINAESAAAVSAAAAMMDGRLGAKIKEIGHELFTLIGNMEVVLDYPDETEDEVLPESVVVISQLIKKTENLLETADTGRLIKNGINVVIAGKPNSGKSSLLNCILKTERAIVSPYAGTTRDLITESFEYDGIKINFTDSAGLRESSDEIEQIGVDYAKKAISTADSVILLKDVTEKDDIKGKEKSGEFDVFASVPEGKKVFSVYTKCDLDGDRYGIAADGTFRISAKNGGGVKLLLDAVVAGVKKGITHVTDGMITGSRHIACLKDALKSLKAAKSAMQTATTDCVIIDLRTAYRLIGEITGDTASEKIIDDIFSRFCVGK